MKYKNLGSHLSLADIDELKEYSSVYQFCLHDPKRFVYDTDLDVEANKWKLASKNKVLVCHAPYNTNIICNNRNLKDSVFSLTKTAQTCSDCAIPYLVIHPGILPFKSKKLVADAIKYTRTFIERFLVQYTKVNVLLENLACLRALGIEALYSIVKDYPNMGLCIDTNHAHGHGEKWSMVKKFIKKEKTRVIHLNAVPAGLAPGSGLDIHSKTSIGSSVGIAPAELKKIVFDYPNKVKIMEQFPVYALKSFRFLEK